MDLSEVIFEMSPPRTPFVRDWRPLTLGRPQGKSMRARKRRVAKARWLRRVAILHEWPA